MTSLAVDQPRWGETKRTRAGRTLRNKKYRRAVEETCKTKRLFTPEIKRFLKGWLVRRRKNPYPNRSEKKDLAIKTGLTYMQICNWFANWRRKLKRSSEEETLRSAGDGGGVWGQLIAGYNQQTVGNAEHISVSSEDSLWDEANCNLSDSQPHTTEPESAGQSLLLKWLESAARYRPREWRPPARRSAPVRHRAELDAAETLAFLARSRQERCA